MLRRNLESLLLFVSIGVMLTSCDKESNDQLTAERKNQLIAEIRPVIQQMKEAYKVLDFDGSFEPVMESSDFVYVSNGQFSDYSNLKNGGKKFFESISSHQSSIETEKFTVISDVAVIYTYGGSAEIKFKSGSELALSSVATTQLFEKINGKWRVTYMHESAVMATDTIKAD